MAYGVGFAQGDFIQHNYHWRDVLTHVRGTHTLRFGYEGWYVVSVPALISESERMRAAHVGQHVAPVVVVLDEVTLRESDSIGHAPVKIGRASCRGRV